MAEMEQRPRVIVEMTLRLDEAEARALEAIAGYGADEFLKVFYQHMGKAYLQPHECGLRSLFDGVRQHVPPILRRAADARKAFEADSKGPAPHAPAERRGPGPMTPDLARLRSQIAGHLDAIARLFKAPKLTIIVRAPDLDGDLIMTDDDLGAAISAIERLRTRRPVPPDSKYPAAASATGPEHSVSLGDDRETT